MRPQIQPVAIPARAAPLVVQATALRLGVQQVLELPVVREQEMEQPLAARAPERPEAVEPQGRLQVEATLLPGAAPGVGQESARAGSE